jgi:hypothetical protein
MGWISGNSGASSKSKTSRKTVDTGYWTDTASNVFSNKNTNKSAMSVLRNAGYRPYDTATQLAHSPSWAVSAAKAGGAYGFSSGGSSGNPGSTTSSKSSGGGGGWGGGGWGGGGGGGGGPTLNQKTVDLLAQIYAQAQPEDLVANKFTMDAYKAPAFYKWDGSQYSAASKGLRDAVANARSRANNAYTDAAYELDQYKNPFASAGFATDPGVSNAMRRMLQAQGVGTEGTEGTTREGMEADRAMGNVMRLLSGVSEEARGSRARALAGDARRTDEMISSQQTDLSTGIAMARARALSEYKKEKWLYGTQVARQRYEDKLQKAMINWQRANTVSDTNVANQNQFNQGMLDPITQLMMANPSLKFDALKKVLM